MKRIVILGSTGSIGRQTLAIVRQYPDELKIIGLSGNKNLKLLKEQVKEFKPKLVGVGENDLVKLTSMKEADTVVIAVSGLAGLLPALSAIKAGKRICFANKEILVVAGELVMKEAKKYQTEMIPVDSEISALFQSLKNEDKKTVRKLIITMGKGKLALMNSQELKKVTLAQIFNRKVWNLGLKIGIDSATGINKSFEVIEASRFFDIPYSQIEIVVHPQYLCHSLVEFENNSLIGEFGWPDMKRYIQYAIFYPERKGMPRLLRPVPDGTGLAMTNTRNDNNKEFSLVGKTLTFEKPPLKKFPCLTLGFEALKAGGTMPAVLHGADETAVDAFISGKIYFTDIYLVIKKTMDKHKVITNPDLEELIKAEKWGRKEARRNL